MYRNIETPCAYTIIWRNRCVRLVSDDPDTQRKMGWCGVGGEGGETDPSKCAWLDKFQAGADGRCITVVADGSRCGKTEEEHISLPLQQHTNGSMDKYCGSHHWCCNCARDRFNYGSADSLLETGTWKHYATAGCHRCFKNVTQEKEPIAVAAEIDRKEATRAIRAGAGGAYTQFTPKRDQPSRVHQQRTAPHKRSAARADQPCKAHLHVRIERATDLPDDEGTGSCSPCCEVFLESADSSAAEQLQKQDASQWAALPSVITWNLSGQPPVSTSMRQMLRTTQVKRDQPNPTWNESFSYPIDCVPPQKGTMLQLRVCNHHNDTGELVELGRCREDIRPLVFDALCGRGSMRIQCMDIEFIMKTESSRLTGWTGMTET